MEFSPCLRLLGSVRGCQRQPQIISSIFKSRTRAKHGDSNGSQQQANASIYTQTNGSHAREIGGESNHIKNRLLYMPVFSNIEDIRDRTAMLDQGQEYSYEDLYMRSWDLAKGLLGLIETGWTNQKVCILCHTGLANTVITWSCWMAGNTVVPLPPHATQERLEYLIRDSGCSLVLTTKEQADRVNPFMQGRDSPKLVVLDDSWWKNPEEMTDRNSPLPDYFVDNSVYKDGSAMMLYTLGRSSGRPRGVIVSHAALGTQINDVVTAWGYTADDSVLHCLPWHQVYGLVNTLHAPLSVGAQINCLNSVDIPLIWSYILGVGVTSGKKYKKITVFPGSPLMYKQLLDKASEIFRDNKTKDYVKLACTKRLRLMTSCSTSMSDQIRQQWRSLTGHSILENYILTESGTTFCNNACGPSNLQGPGNPGLPIGNIETRLVRFRDHTKKSLDVLAEGGDHGTKVLVDDYDENVPIIGELLIKGEGIAPSYWRDGEDKARRMVEGGWLETGDILKYTRSCYSVIGRLNIKAVEKGRELVSATGIEKKILASPDILDCYIVGLGDTDAEQVLAAVLVLNHNRKITMENILSWCAENLSKNETPSVFKMVKEIPRDQSGHVDKLAIFSLFPDIPVLCFHDSKF